LSCDVERFGIENYQAHLVDTQKQGDQRMAESWGMAGGEFRDCEGWWEQDGFGRQPMDALCIAFNGQRIQGSGTDIIGPFVLEGVFGELGAVAILKQYLGQHSVDYEGHYDGEGAMLGQWRIGPYRGRWFIRLRRDKRNHTAEIVEFVPKS
jgi:hypothetical protein